MSTFYRSYALRVTPTVGYVDVPAHDVYHPGITVYTQGFDGFYDPAVGGVTVNPDGWTPTGTAGTPYFATSRTQPPYLGDYHAGAYVQSAGSIIVSRTVTGLTVGMPTTFSAVFRSSTDANQVAQLGVDGIGVSATVSTPKTWVRINYTFTPTATSHTMQLIRSSAGVGGAGEWDDISVTQNAYTERIPDHMAGLDPIDFKPIDGTVDLTETRIPYGAIEVQISLPTAAQLAVLDPRLSPRVRLTMIQAPVPNVSSTANRDFTMVLRGRVVDHNAGTVTLQLATYDAKLVDYTRVATTSDTSPLAVQSSVRAIVQNVMTTAGTGATLAPGTADADFTTLTALTNNVPNGSFESGILGWTAANCTLTSSTQWSYVGSRSLAIVPNASSAGSYAEAPLNLTPGATYTVTGYFRLASALTGTLAARTRMILVIGTTGGTNTAIGESNVAPNAAGVTKLQVTFTVPTGFTSYTMRLNNGASTGNGNAYFDAVILTEGNGKETDLVNDLAYFDGATANTSTYGYAWTGTAYNSASTRTPVFERSPDSLTWGPGVDAYDFLQPVLEASGLRLFCDETMTWKLVANDYVAPGLLAVTPTSNLYVATDEIGQGLTNVDGTPLYFDAAVLRYTWTDKFGVSQTRYDAYSLPGGSGTSAFIDYQRPYPGPGAAKYIVNRVANRGRQLGITTAFDIAPQVSQEANITFPLTDSQVGYVSGLTWSLFADELVVTTRGLIQTPATAWLYRAAGITWASVAAGVSWNTYN